MLLSLLLAYHRRSEDGNVVLFSVVSVGVSVCVCVCVCVMLVNVITLKLFEISIIKLFFYGSEARTSSKMAAVLIHWQIQGWSEDLRSRFDNPGSATAACGCDLTTLTF